MASLHQPPTPDVSLRDGAYGADVVISRATTPIPGKTAEDGGPGTMTLPIRELAGSPPELASPDDRRYRPRTFSYMSLLPFDAEPESVRDEALSGILRQLYTAIRSEDFAPGALFWSRQLQSWLQLKFEMPRALRAKLTTMYYHLALAPGLDPTVSDRFVNMVVTLTRKYHYLKPGVDLILDWRPLWEQLKMLVFSDEFPPHTTGRRKPHKQTWKLLVHCRLYFDPRERGAMLREFLPHFGMPELADAFVVTGLINAFLPTTPIPGGGDPDDPAARPDGFMPTLFHLWALVARSRNIDTFLIDLFCCMARDFLKAPDVPFTQYGIFSKEQSDHIFTAILRLTDVPVGEADSPYSNIDYGVGIATLLEKDKKRYPVSYMAARWIVNCLSDRCLEHEDSTMASLEGLIESIETFFHPSNQGAWTTMLGQLTHYLVELFILRWNRERSGELEVPAERRISPALRKRFVLCLREVVFMGLFCKSSRVAQYYYSSLHGLAFLEPSLILPGALQRFYPSLQGLVEVHRTTSSLNSLQVLANILSRQKGFRCHVTALLALALPGIDANDLNKTQWTLAFIQSVAYSIPMAPLVRDGDGEIHGTSLAMGWVQAEMERMEREGQEVRIDYDAELSDADEVAILKSSTAGLGEFILTLLGRVFTLLENLPDSGMHGRPGGPEENVINALPSALGPIFASLSPELFELALDKVGNFVASHVVHQAREAMAWIVNALCKARPEATLKRFVPMLIVNIRNEIDQNNAASDRSSGTDYLPRDRALVWNMVMLAMLVVHVGRPLMEYKDDIFEVTRYMQEKCRGLPTIHIGNLIHHVLLTLTRTYPIDHGLYEPDVIARGPTAADWGRTTSPSELTIRWHRPSPDEVAFAVELFAWQAEWAGEALGRLMGESEASVAARKGKNKEWSDEMVRVLQQVRLVLSGMATLFDPERTGRGADGGGGGGGGGDDDDDDDDDDANAGLAAQAEAEGDSNPLAEVADDEGMRPSYHYEAGYVLRPGDAAYERIHVLRDTLGRLLSDTHEFLHAHQEDDVACLTALYTAYRTWITDVGVERSAHPLERHSRLYRAHIAPFSITGLRKAYPRPLLVNRAEAYLIQRVKHNAMTRRRSALDRRLLLDLAASCLSPYTEVRRVAQAVQDAALKTLIGSRPLVVPVVIGQFRAALASEDHDRIKGAMYTLLYTSLTRTVSKDWRFAPDVIRLYLETATIDKQSIQMLGAKFLMAVLDFTKPLDRALIEDKGVVEVLAAHIEDAPGCEAEIRSRNAFITDRRNCVQALKIELGQELTRRAREAHWKIASRCSVIANGLCVRFQTLAPPEFVEFVTLGVNDPHPGLRTTQAMAFGGIFVAFRARAVYGHDYSRYLTGKAVPLGRIDVEVPEEVDSSYTDRYLAGFADEKAPDYYVDTQRPGWLVWGRRFRAAERRPVELEYDKLETSVRAQIGALLTREWFATLFGYLKQEPRDSAYDRFRMSNVYTLENAFGLVVDGVAAATLDDLRELADDIYGDGTDKHQHRATAEILAALLVVAYDHGGGEMDDEGKGGGGGSDSRRRRRSVWAWVAPRMVGIMSTDLTPESANYWLAALHVVLDTKDPRRWREFLDVFASFRVDMASNAAFKDSTKISMLETCFVDGGWQLSRHPAARDVLADMVAHLEHPYKSVRESVGRCISTLHRMSYHESFSSVDELLRANAASSSLGLRPYEATPELRAQIEDVFARLERWRREREPGQQTPSAYTSGSKTVLSWLDSTLSSHECTIMVPFFPAPFMEQLLHMMDVKEDPELMRSAYHVYRHIPNVPLRPGEDGAVVAALVRIGSSAPSWHQRLRALINLQVLYFRNIFITAPETRAEILRAVCDMLADSQLEVRTYASNSLAGMIRCLPRRLRDPEVLSLKRRFFKALDDNPMPPSSSRRTLLRQATGGSTASGMSTPVGGGASTPGDMLTPGGGESTPAEVQAQVVRRHAAVLGLGALIEAFPYATPPPQWMPEVLAALASRAASDPGVVGKATKAILSDFKKTRHDSWSVDQKYFTPEQLEDLEGVLWKSYFA